MMATTEMMANEQRRAATEKTAPKRTATDGSAMIKKRKETKKQSAADLEKRLYSLEEKLKRAARNGKEEKELLREYERLDRMWMARLDAEEGTTAEKDDDDDGCDDDCVYHLVDEVELGEMDDPSIPIRVCDPRGVVTAKDPIRLFSDAENTLHPHQRRAFDDLVKGYTSSLPCCLLSIAPGAGKTLIALSFLDAVTRAMPKGSDSFSVVVAPKSVLPVWKMQHAMWSHILPSLPPIQEDFCAKGPGIYLANPEVIQHLPSRPYSVLVADELHGYCTLNTNQSQHLRSIRARFKVGLSGTFFKTNTRDYFHALLSLLPNEGRLSRCVEDLRRRFHSAEEEKRKGGAGSPSRALSTMLGPLLHECTSTVTSESLPPLEEVTLVYSAPSELVTFPTLDVKTDSELKNNLIPVQRKWIERLKEGSATRGRIIFCVQRIELIPSPLAKGEFRITGSISTLERQKAISDFRESEKGVLYLSDAALEGIDLSFCSNIVLVGDRFNPALGRQAICRCHRYGQTKPVLAIRLIAGAQDKTRLSASAEWRQYQDAIRKVLEGAAIRGLTNELEKMDEEDGSLYYRLPPPSKEQKVLLSHILPSLPISVTLFNHNPVRQTGVASLTREEAFSETARLFHGSKKRLFTRIRVCPLLSCSDRLLGPDRGTKTHLLRFSSPGVEIDPSTTNDLPVASLPTGKRSFLKETDLLLLDESGSEPVGVGRLRLA